MSKKLKISIITLLLLVFVYVYAAPYWVIYQIRQALENQNSEALSRYVDFPSVRQGLKDQFNTTLLKQLPEDAHLSEGSLARLGAMLASSMVDKVVDVMVSPEGVSMLLQGKKLKQALPQSTETQPMQTEVQKAQEKVSYRSHYQSLNQFVVEVQRPEQQSHLNVIMQRRGLSWKVTQIQLPMEQLQ